MRPEKPVFVRTSHPHTKSYSPGDLEIDSLNLCQMLSYCFITMGKITFRYENFHFKIKFWTPKPKTQKTGSLVY